MSAHSGLRREGTGPSPTTVTLSVAYVVVGETPVVSRSGGFSRRANTRDPDSGVGIRIETLLAVRNYPSQL